MIDPITDITEMNLEYFLHTGILTYTFSNNNHLRLK